MNIALSLLIVAHLYIVWLVYQVYTISSVRRRRIRRRRIRRR